MKFEYKLVVIQRKGLINVSWPMEELNREGANGWEAVGIVQTQTDSIHNAQQVSVLMKKNK